MARRKGFEPRPTGRAPFRSAASGTAPYSLPRFSSPNCACLRNLVLRHALRMIRFAQKTLRVLRSGVRIIHKIQKETAPQKWSCFFWHAVRDSNPRSACLWHALRLIRFAQKTLRVLRSGVRIIHKIQKETAPQKWSCFFWHAVRDSNP